MKAVGVVLFKRGLLQGERHIASADIRKYRLSASGAGLRSDARQRPSDVTVTAPAPKLSNWDSRS
jgi:hypothetical protein